MKSIGVGARVAVVLGALSVGGCSFMFLHPDQRDYGPDGAPVCTRSWDGVVLDGIFATASGVAAHYLWPTDNPTQKLEAVGFGVASALWLASAIYALVDGIECTELKAEYAPPPVYHPRRPRLQPQP